MSKTTHSENQGLTFGLALEALKAGKAVARAGWNGKGMFLFLLPAGNGIPKSVIHDPALKAIADLVPGDVFKAHASIRMFTAEGKILTGWLASQTDMLSEDWAVVDPAQQITANPGCQQGIA